jgi:hypothetical protein
VFGEAAIQGFLQANNFELIIRAHQATSSGFGIAKSAKVCTVFSTSKDHGCGRHATCGCILVENGAVTAITRSEHYTMTTFVNSANLPLAPSPLSASASDDGVTAPPPMPPARSSSPPKSSAAQPPRSPHASSHVAPAASSPPSSSSSSSSPSRIIMSQTRPALSTTAPHTGGSGRSSSSSPSSKYKVMPLGGGVCTI